MTMPILHWLALLGGLALLVHACRLLAADAREGFEVTMGGAMLFSHVWTLGAALCAWSATMLLDQPWWKGLLLFAALFLLKSVAYRIIVALYLGRELPPPKTGGFKDFVRRSEQVGRAQDTAPGAPHGDPERDKNIN